ncbi:DUF2326 domain-containing protein [Isoptericola sediminis]|uniref:DUF2326 domain-containing protein n=1 Tax=Isoptericola sediminis TaxID=2733572 RepID=A0A849JZD6_9MICO|nr:DUF2326 domain-containing protein [Isoptericola sediminis]NNU26168.1 DUF2326 domain-containing protein [Isoptericola sediminis]
MLVRLSANKPEFTSIEFRSGFNVIVAEKADKATDQDTRNARGKTTLLLFIHYVLGGSLHKNLKPLADDGWEITLTLELFGGEVAATRSLANGTRVGISAAEQPQRVLDTYMSEGSISVDDWKALLGLALFALEPEVELSKGGLSVRTLLSYAIRTDPPKDPLKVLAQQSAASTRAHVSYLMGLDWTLVDRLHRINTATEQIRAITAATKEGVVRTLRPEADLVLERAVLANDLEEWRSRVDSFTVLEDPNSLVERADEITSTITSLRDESLVDHRMLSLYESSAADSVRSANEEIPVEAVLAAAQASLSDGLKRQIDSVRAFRDELLENRVHFLQIEIDAIRERISSRELQLSQLSAQRARILQTLHAGGALDELISMRSELSEYEARVAALDVQIAQAREVAARKDQLKLEQSTVRAEAGQDLTARREKVDRISDEFSRKMHRLYGKDAALTVAVDDGGFKFAITASGSGSSGIDKMKLFCFDLTLLEEGTRSQHHPDFLVHDSSVFDGVDPRQVTKALRFAQEMVASTGGQYICTMNSNDVPDEVLAEEWFKQGVIRTILDTELGGLVGRDF